MWNLNPRSLPLLVAIAIALVTSFHGIANKSLWLDEAFSIALARLDWASMWRVIAQDQANMMLYHVLLHFWLRLGTGEFVARAASALFSVASIVPLYLLGRRLLGERPAAMAALLMAVNSFFVRFAQEARGYSLVLLLTTTASYFFVVALEEPSWKRWSAYVMVAALSVYAHFFGALVVAAHVLSLLLKRRRQVPLTKLALVYALIGLLISPLVSLAWGTRHLEWATKPSLLDVRYVFWGLSGGGRTLLWGYCVACLIAVVSTLAAPRSRRQGWSRVLLLSLLLLPITTVFIVSITLKPMFSDRYFIMMLSPLLLLVAAGIESLPPLWLRFTAFIVLAVLGIRGLLRWYAAPPPENWRAASAYVLGAAQPGDGVAFEAPYVRIPFEYYLRLKHAESYAPEPLYPTARWGGFDILDPQISRGVSDWPVGATHAPARLWVVQSHIVPPVSHDAARIRVPAYVREQYQVVDERAFQGIRVLLYLPHGPSQP